MKRFDLRMFLMPLALLSFAPFAARGQIVQLSAPLPAAEAARTMKVPAGFRVTAFAAEPDVRQPIGFCLDDRGRLWVAEAYSYPKHAATGHDRIVILEDVDGDGRHDKRTVFYDKLNYVTGIEVGFGGAWVVSPPSLYFIPDRDGDDKPDGPPQTLLDGFGNHANSHNLASALAWGPDGWLYGTHGRTNWSTIGKPGTPADKRTRFDGGVYRYHPVRHEWEPFADGMTNPWGVDWDDFGQAFACNCVDPHLFHIIQGAHYEPWRNRESSRFAYERLATIADHLHYTGKGKSTDGLGTPAEDLAGGGHAHCGTMIYLGDSWPDRYRNTAFMHNIHGRRINNDPLRRVGSGYIASHGPDLLRSQDPWFMGVMLQYGPDGAAYSCDWSDVGECHSTVNTQRGTGRIFKIAYGDAKAQPVDLARASDAELVALQDHRNDWFVRHARRLLQERAAAGKDNSAAVAELQRKLKSSAPVERKLRYLWALFAVGRADDSLLEELLADESEYLRAWSARLLTENRTLSPSQVVSFEVHAERDASAFVALHLASTLQRLPFAQRWRIAEKLAERREFARDANIPLMLWYGVEPLVADDLKRFVRLGVRTEMPTIRRHVARRVADLGTPAALEALVRGLGELRVDELRRQLLEGALQGLEGARSLAMPASWRATYAKLRESKDGGVRESADRLALLFDDPVVIAAFRKLAGDAKAPSDSRIRAIQALAVKRPPGFDSELIALMRDAVVRGAAIRALAAFDRPETPAAVLAVYAELDAAEKQDALHTLAARPAWARALVDALDAGKLPRGDVTAFTARQIHSLRDRELSARIERQWGTIRETPQARRKAIADYKRRLTPEVLQTGDRSRGRAVYTQHCGNCHKLFDAGGAVGPELTGAQRSNLDYLLLHTLDPSAEISKDFQMYVVATADGRVVTGLLAAETDRALTIQTAAEKLTIPKSEVERRAVSEQSMMPDGLLQRLTEAERRDLFAYLMGREQVSLPAKK